MKNKTVIPRKKRGPPATGKGEPVVVRMQPTQLRALDHWIADQAQPFPSRPEAIRRLVELGLSVDKPQAETPARISARAKRLAGRAIDGLADQQASTGEQADRKRDLLGGPEEFRNVRVDHRKKGLSPGWSRSAKNK